MVTQLVNQYSFLYPKLGNETFSELNVVFNNYMGHKIFKFHTYIKNESWGTKNKYMETLESNFILY